MAVRKAQSTPEVVSAETISFAGCQDRRAALSAGADELEEKMRLAAIHKR